MAPQALHVGAMEAKVSREAVAANAVLVFPFLWVAVIATGIGVLVPAIAALAPPSLCTCVLAKVSSNCRDCSGRRRAGGGDVYVLQRVLHDWDDARARSIVRACRAAIRPDGVLLALEVVLPERFEANPMARTKAFWNLNILVVSSG